MRSLLYMAEKLCSHFFLILWGEMEKIVKEERKWLLNYTALLRSHICHWSQVKATSEGLFFTPKLNCFKLNTFSRLFAQSLFHALHEDLASHISDTEHFCHELYSLWIHARNPCIYDCFSFLNYWPRREQDWWMSSKSEIWIARWCEWHVIGELLNIKRSCQQRIVTGICMSLCSFSF